MLWPGWAGIFNRQSGRLALPGTWAARKQQRQQRNRTKQQSKPNRGNDLARERKREKGMGKGRVGGEKRKIYRKRKWNN